MNTHEIQKMDSEIDDSTVTPAPPHQKKGKKQLKSEGKIMKSDPNVILGVSFSDKPSK